MMADYRSRLCALTVTLALSGAVPAMAQLSSEGGPIRVNADNSTVYERERKVLVVGNVDIIQSGARLRADRVTLNYAPRQDAQGAIGIGGGFGDIETMLAEGRVFYVTPEIKARGDVGTYDAKADTITMTGSVILVRGEDVARGETLVIEVGVGRSVLDGGEGRVQMLIVPAEDTPGPAGASAGAAGQIDEP